MDDGGKEKTIFQNIILLDFALRQLSSVRRELLTWSAQQIVRAYGAPGCDGHAARG